MACYNVPVALRTDLKNTITCMRAFGMTEADIVGEVCRVLHGLYYSEDSDL